MRPGMSLAELGRGRSPARAFRLGSFKRLLKLIGREDLIGDARYEGSAHDLSKIVR
jgi:hypothetical protein